MMVRTTGLSRRRLLLASLTLPLTFLGCSRRRTGEQQVVDLTAVAGTYITIAMMLAMAEQSIPAGEELPFKANEP